MPNDLHREELAEGIYFSHITDTKFIGNRISVSFMTPLLEETAAENAIVPSILRLGCKSCPDFTALNKRLALLYGAQAFGDVTKYGATQILSVSVKGIDDRFALKGEKMVKELAALLCELVLDPLLEGDGFSENYTALERQNLIDSILSEINDKRTWAQIRCVSLMLDGSPAALRPYGTVKAVKSITPKSAYNAYKRLLKTAAIEIVFAGSGDFCLAKDEIKNRFSGIEREYSGRETRPLPEFSGEAREITETMDVSQSKLCIGFRAAPKSEREVSALRMMSSLYGGTPFAKLFLNVREKLSLCYYCSSRYERGNSLLLVNSGVEKDKKEAACEEILNQLEAMRSGDFTDEEFENTRLALKTGFLSVGDSLGALEGWYLSQIAAKTLNSPDKELSDMMAVTREDIVFAAKSLKQDMIYFLTSSDRTSEAALNGEGEN